MDEKSQAAYCTLPAAHTSTLGGVISGDITAAPADTISAAPACTRVADQTTSAQTIDIAAGGTIELWWELT